MTQSTRSPGRWGGSAAGLATAAVLAVVVFTSGGAAATPLPTVPSVPGEPVLTAGDPVQVEPSLPKPTDPPTTSEVLVPATTLAAAVPITLPGTL